MSTDALRHLGRVHEHQKWALHRAAAGDDGVEGRVMFLGDLILAGDMGEPCHGVSFLVVG